MAELRHTTDSPPDIGAPATGSTPLVATSGTAKHLALGSFARQIRAMPVTGGILRTGHLDRERDFVEAESAAAVLVDLVRNPAASGQIVNVCSGQPRSLASFVDALIARSPAPVGHEYDPARRGNSDAVRYWGADDRLAALGHVLKPADPLLVARSLLG